MSAYRRAVRAGHFAHAVQLLSRAERRRHIAFVATSASLSLAGLLIWTHLIVQVLP